MPYRVHPEESPVDAFQVTLLAEQYKDHVLDDLFRRGYDCWQEDDGGRDDEGIVKAIEAFGDLALKDSFEHGDREDSIASDPASLVIMSTHACLVALDHDALNEGEPKKAQPYYDIRDFALEEMRDLIYRQSSNVPIKHIAERMYRKPPEPGRPFPGRVCEGIVNNPEWGEAEAYMKIPLVAASKETLALDAERDDRGRLVGEKTVKSHLRDNTVYVPIDDFFDRLTGRWEKAFDNLYRYIDETMPGKQRSWLLRQEDKITHRLDRYQRANRREQLWKNYDHDRYRVNVLIKAVEESRNDIAQLGEPLTAQTIDQALSNYDASETEEDAATSFRNPRSIAQFLSDQTHRNYIEKVEDRKLNKYILRPQDTGAKPVVINDLDDLFELPCFANIDERLQKKGPTRKELYSLVRLVAWLQEYRIDKSETELIEDLKDLLSRWPWYDEQTSDYQIRYELEKGEIDGRSPLPIGCNNDDMQMYCIGQDECPYSIYGSLELDPEVYDLLDEVQNSFDGW